MSRSQSLFARAVSALVAIAMLGTALLIGPAPQAHADESQFTLFRAEFNNVPLGPVSGPLQVDQGTVLAEAGNVAVSTAGDGRVLAIDGTAGLATALLQWTNYPGPLPRATARELTLKLEARLTAADTNGGASFGVLTGSTFFELFSFGAGGALTRNGQPLGLSYSANTTVTLDARINIKASGSTVRINLRSGATRVSVEVALDSAFNAATLNQLRFQTTDGSGVATIDQVKVRLNQKTDDPPAVIIIGDDDIKQEIEIINTVIFINLTITIVNTGGSARGAVLILDMDDLESYFDLADISFLIGVGYVQQIDGQRVMIGLGQNNIIGKGDLKLKIKFKAKTNRLDIKVSARFSLRYDDSSGEQTLPLPPVVIVVTPPTGPAAPTTPGEMVERLPITVIDVRLKRTWQARGGLAIFGLPIGQPVTLANGVIVQYFERARLEYHPELAGTAYEVLIGLLAVELGYREQSAAPPENPQDLAWYYRETGHVIALPFRSYWRTRGGLALFGLPIGAARSENGRTVQYFERARLELHPDLAGTPYEVQLGLLGVERVERDD